MYDSLPSPRQSPVNPARCGISDLIKLLIVVFFVAKGTMILTIRIDIKKKNEIAHSEKNGDDCEMIWFYVLRVFVSNSVYAT